MGDLIVGIGCIGIGLAGLIGVHIMRAKDCHAVNPADDSVITALRAELTRCAGAMMHCARRGDRRGARHAHRAMKPILRELEAAERSRRGGKSWD